MFTACLFAPGVGRIDIREILYFRYEANRRKLLLHLSVKFQRILGKSTAGYTRTQKAGKEKQHVDFN